MKCTSAPKVRRVVVPVPAFDLLSRRIIRAARGKDREIAERLLGEALRETPIRSRSAQQMCLLDDSRAGRLQSKGGRPRDDDMARTVCRVFDGLCIVLPNESDRAIMRRMSNMQWPVWNALDVDDPALPDDDEARAIKISEVTMPASYRTIKFENLRRIIGRRRKLGTKPI